MASVRAYTFFAARSGVSRACQTTAAKRAWARRYFVPAVQLRQEATILPKESTSSVPESIIGTAAQFAKFSQQSKAELAESPFSNRIPIEIDGQTREFDAIFLRDSCKCAACVDPSSTQKNFETAEIPSGIEGSCQVTGGPRDAEVAVINWRGDLPHWPEGHETALPIQFLREALSKEDGFQVQPYQFPARTMWDAATMSRDVRFIDYNDYMKSDKSLYDALRLLQTHGLVFLKNVPDTIATDSSISVASIVERIGSIRHTFYGRTWDVKSVPQAKNVAYTHVYLGLHMDLCYMDNTPHLQFLHSMRARAPGGESMFSDSFLAAETIRREDPELFDALRTFGVTYNYFNAGEAYRQVRPTVILEDQEDPNSAIRWLNWSPPFQGPFAQDIGVKDGGKALRTYHAAAQRFSQISNAPENIFELKMKEGECVIFDNRRTLHARRAFEASKGERWLKGAYMDRDAYASRLGVLGQIYGLT